MKSSSRRYRTKPAVLPAKKKKKKSENPTGAPSFSKDDFLRRGERWHDVNQLHDGWGKERCRYQSRAAPPWLLSGNFLSFRPAENRKRAARWTTRTSPNHTRCSSAEDVASARAVERQNGEGENTVAYSAALEK